MRLSWFTQATYLCGLGFVYVDGFASAAGPLWKLNGSGDPRTSRSEVVVILGCLGAILGHVGLSLEAILGDVGLSCVHGGVILSCIGAIFGLS
jgi:hypothetical protein